MNERDCNHSIDEDADEDEDVDEDTMDVEEEKSDLVAADRELRLDNAHNMGEY